MVAITLRADLTRGLTNAEIDANFSALKTAVEGAAASAAWATITGKPTTLAGYGITDTLLTPSNYTSYAMPAAGPSGGSNGLILVNASGNPTWSDINFTYDAATASFRAVNFRAVIGTSAPTWNFNNILHAANYSSYALPLSGGTLASGVDGILTLNKTAGSAWNYINFSVAGTRRFYFGLNASYEPELGTDNGGTFRVLGPLTVQGNTVLTAGNYTNYFPGWTSGVVGNNLVQRDPNGYIYVNYVNHSSSESENPSINSIFVSNGDGWTRKASQAHFISQLGLATSSSAYPQANTPGGFVTPSGGVNGATNGWSALDGYGALVPNYGGSDWWVGVWTGGNSSRGIQIAGGYSDSDLWFRKGAGGWNSWIRLLNSSNYTSYTDGRYVFKTGDTMTGTLKINTTGSSSASSHFIIKRSGASEPGSFGSYAGSWRSSIEVWNNDSTRMLFLNSAENDFGYAHVKSVNGGMVLDVGSNGGTRAIQIEYSGATTVNGSLTGHGGGYFRKAQTAGNYTTAALWTESYDNTATGIAFHISGVVGKYLEMRTNGTLYWNGDVVLHSGNYNSYSPSLTGGNASGTWGINITGTSSALAVTGLTSFDYPGYTRWYWSKIAHLNAECNAIIDIQAKTDFNYVPYVYCRASIGSWNGSTVSAKLDCLSSYDLGIYLYIDNNNDVWVKAEAIWHSYLVFNVIFNDGTTIYTSSNATLTSAPSNSVAIGPGQQVRGTYGSMSSATPQNTQILVGSVNARGDLYANNGSTVLHAGNYSSYALPLSGGTMSGRLYHNEWIQFNNYTGLYSPNNGAHFYPNDGSYGAWRIQGSRNGWRGITFDGSVTLMMNDNESGHYKDGYGWQFRWYDGTFRVAKNSYGANEAVVLDASNYTNYTLPIGGSWYGTNLPGSRWGGFAVGGGEIAFGNGLPNAGQMGILVDGCYVAGENNGFWSLGSDNTWGSRRGMYWDGSYLRFDLGSPIVKAYAMTVGNWDFYDNSGGWNANILAAGIYHGRVRVKASSYNSSGDQETYMWVDNTVNPATGIYSTKGTFNFNGNISSVLVAGNTILHAGNYTNYTPVRVASTAGYGHAGTGMYPFYNWGGSGVGASAPSDGSYTIGISVGSHPSDQAYGFQIARNMWATGLWTRGYDSGWGSWVRLLDSSNYTNYAVSATYNSSLNSDSRNSRGVTRLYRRDDNSDYSVQTYWTGSYWRLYGYNGDSGHADTHVGYADSAGSVSGGLTTSNYSSYALITGQTRYRGSSYGHGAYASGRNAGNCIGNCGNISYGNCNTYFDMTNANYFDMYYQQYNCYNCNCNCDCCC